MQRGGATNHTPQNTGPYPDNVEQCNLPCWLPGTVGYLCHHNSPCINAITHLHDMANTWLKRRMLSQSKIVVLGRRGIVACTCTPCSRGDYKFSQVLGTDATIDFGQRLDIETD